MSAHHPGAHKLDLSDDSDSFAGDEKSTREEIRQHDHETLTGEEEAERLLNGAEGSGGGGGGGEKRSIRRHRNRRKLEEGNRSSSETSSTTSSQEDIRRTAKERTGERKVCRYKTSRRQDETLADPHLIIRRAKRHSVDDLPPLPL